MVDKGEQISVKKLAIFIVGPAGSGKTSLTASLSDFLKANDIPVETINLDPAAEKIPYLPDLDVREYVFAPKIMHTRGLGPNGAIVVATDLMIEHLPKLIERISLDEGLILIDTPGQMEVFVFRKSGEAIYEQFRDANIHILTIFVADITLASSPSLFVSSLFLSASTYYRYLTPFIQVFNKVDLVGEDVKEKILIWINSRENLLHALDAELIGEQRTMNTKIVDLIEDFLEIAPVFFVSATKMHGYTELVAEILRYFTGGDAVY